MPKYQMPKGDNARLTFLTEAKRTAEKDITAGNDYLSQETLDQISVFIPDFEAAVISMDDASTLRAKEVKEQNQALEKIQMYVRDIWELIRRRVKRLSLPTYVLKYYRLPLDGTSPNPNTRKEWLILAKRMIIGDEKAVAVGYEPMKDPTAAELSEVLETVHTEVGDVAESDRNYDLAQAAAADFRPRADALIKEVMDELSYRLRKLDSASVRRIKRTYGAKYRYLKGESEDENGRIEDENNEVNLGNDTGDDTNAKNDQDDEKRHANPVADLATSGK